MVVAAASVEERHREFVVDRERRASRELCRLPDRGVKISEFFVCRQGVQVEVWVSVHRCAELVAQVGV